MDASDLSWYRGGGAGGPVSAGSQPLAVPGVRVLRGEGILRMTRTTTPARLVLAGDIDISTHAALIVGLAEIAAGWNELHIDMAGVDYCDLASLRILIGRSDGPRAVPQRVILHGVPAQLNKVLHILGWETAPGLSIADVRTEAPIAS